MIHRLNRNDEEVINAIVPCVMPVISLEYNTGKCTRLFSVCTVIVLCTNK